MDLSLVVKARPRDGLVALVIEVDPLPAAGELQGGACTGVSGTEDRDAHGVDCPDLTSMIHRPLPSGNCTRAQQLGRWIAGLDPADVVCQPAFTHDVMEFRVGGDENAVFPATVPRAEITEEKSSKSRQVSSFANAVGCWTKFEPAYALQDQQSVSASSSPPLRDG